MAITIGTPSVLHRTKFGNKKVNIVNLPFSGTYATNGFTVTAANCGLFSLEHALLLDPNVGGFAAGFETTSDLVKLYSKEIPPLVVEEAVTVASNTGTLAYPPLYIVAVQSTAGTTTGAFKVIPTGETPLTTQCAATFTTGVLSFLSTDAVTAAKVTYIPRRPSGYLSTVTVDESVTASTTPVALAARAGLFQYAWDDTDGILEVMEPSGEQPSATHTAVLDILSGSDSTIDFHTSDTPNVIKATYVPFTQLPPGTFINDTDITLSSQVWNFTGDPTVLGYHKTVVPGCGCVLVGEATTTNQEAVWEGPGGTAANLVAVWNPATNSITTAMTTAMTTTAISWMILDPEQLTPATGQEVVAGTTIGSQTMTVMAIGV